jgi:hypothetical protein
LCFLSRILKRVSFLELFARALQGVVDQIYRRHCVGCDWATAPFSSIMTGIAISEFGSSSCFQEVVSSLVNMVKPGYDRRSIGLVLTAETLYIWRTVRSCLGLKLRLGRLEKAYTSKLRWFQFNLQIQRQNLVEQKRLPFPKPLDFILIAFSCSLTFHEEDDESRQATPDYKMIVLLTTSVHPVYVEMI